MKKLAIIGASYLQLPLVKKAKEMGLETLCFSWKKDAVCEKYVDSFYPISITEKEKILAVCQKEKIDAITTIASDLAVLTVTYVADRMGLIANPNDYAVIMTNKYEMRNCFLKASVPSPFYFKVGVDTDVSGRTLKYPLIVKPTDRSGSLGVSKVNNLIELENAILRACDVSFSKEAVVEEFVEGGEISVECLSFKGIHTLLQITDKVTTDAPYFVEIEHHQPSSLSYNIQDKVKSIVFKALDALHIRYGASHSELKISAEGEIKVIEIGGRMGGDFIGSDLVQLSTGYDFLSGVIRCALGEWEEPVLSQSKCSGVFFLSEETQRLEEIIKNWHDYPQIKDAKITNPILRHIECSGDRSGYLIYQSDERCAF